MEKIITDIPLGWLALWAVISILVSFWFYQKKKWLKELSNRVRIILFALRSAGIFAIGVLLLGILFQSNEFRVEKPILINVVDNSGSMLNYADSNQVKNSLVNLEQKVNQLYGNKYDVINYFIDGKNTAGFKTIEFEEPESNLSSIFELIQDKYYQKNIGAITLITDGNFNVGKNPIYSAGKIPLTPIYTIGVGDTLVKADHFIQNVIANDIAFLGNKFPIEVAVEANKIGKKTVWVSLKEGGKQIAKKQITYANTNFDVQTVQFLVEAKSIGVKQYTVEVQPIENEYNFLNNSRSVYIEILDARSKILLISDGPHPDLGALKSVLSKDVNLSIETALLNSIEQNLDQYDLLVLHQPDANKYGTEIDKILRSNKPIWFFIAPGTTSSTLNKLPIGLTVQNTRQFDNVQAKVNEQFNSFELSKTLQKAFNYFPPVQTKYGRIATANNVNTLLFQRLGNVSKKDPLFYFLEQNNLKYGVFYGEGLWRWKLAEFAKTKENIAFEELVAKTTQYLVLKNDASNLRISLPSQFVSNQAIIINAAFYNDNLAPIVTQKIELSVWDEQEKLSKYDFIPQQTNYIAQLGELKPGRYKWKAKTNYNGKSIEKSGDFLVKKLELEQLDTRANHNLLYQIAENSGASFFTLSEINDYYNALQNRKDIAPLKYESEKYVDLIDYKWLFVLIVSLFGLEWFIRRFKGAY